MPYIALTGAGGFIGRAVARLCVANGYDVICLARRPTDQGQWIEWSLGDPLPKQCVVADAVIHLASATLGARDKIQESVKLDISGTRILAESARSLRPDG